MESTIGISRGFRGFRENWEFWLTLGLMLHTAGIYFCENGVIQNLWAAWLVGQTLVFRGAEIRDVFRSTPWLQWVTGWMVIQFITGFLLVRDGLDAKMLFLRGWDLAFVPLILGLWVYSLRRNPRLGNWTMLFVVVIGAVTALISFVAFYSVDGRFPRARLMNQFVNWWWGDGFHPVLSGLIFAFAGTCAMLLFLRGQPRRLSIVLLILQFGLLFAAFFSHSRGALLAAGAGAAVSVVVCWGWRLLPGLAASGLAFGVYFWIYSTGTTVSVPVATKNGTVMAPTASLIERKDAGRFKLYGILLDRMESPREWIVGRGLWAKDRADGWRLTAWAHHPHSLFVTMFYHHGIAGLIFFACLLGGAFWRALRLWRRGSPEWLVLLTFGCAGLVFDGHFLLSLTSIPRIEPLLVLFPMTVALTLGVKDKEETQTT